MKKMKYGQSMQLKEQPSWIFGQWNLVRLVNVWSQPAVSGDYTEQGLFFFYMSRAVSVTQGRCSLAVVGQQYRLLFAAVSSIYLCEQMLSVCASLCFHRFNFNLPPLWFFVPSFIPVLGLGLAYLSLSKECLEQRDKPSFMPLFIHPSISP